jgi:hypothetical protein
LSKENYIISSCVISNSTVIKNNERIFSNKEDNLHSFLISVYHFIKTDYPKFYKMDNLSKLGWLASEILIKEEEAIKEFDPGEIGVMLTNANSSLDADEKYVQSIKQIASPALFVYTLPNIVIGEICIRNNFKGENSFFVFENFNAAFIEQYVNDLFSNNIVQLCICGWVDVLKENYKAALFLVSRNKAQNAVLFNEENLDTIFKRI